MSLLLHTLGVIFTNIFTSSFEVRRFQKRKKILMTWLNSYAFGICATKKAAQKILMKLTQALGLPVVDLLTHTRLLSGTLTFSLQWKSNLVDSKLDSRSKVIGFESRLTPYWRWKWYQRLINVPNPGSFTKEKEKYCR